MVALFIIASCFLLIGLTGSLSGSVALPLIIRRLERKAIARNRKKKPVVDQPFSSLAILVPVVSGSLDMTSLEATISSIKASIAQAKRTQSSFSAEILIGSAELTSEQVEHLPFGARWVGTQQGNRGGILRELVERAWAYDWIAVVEPGTEWSPGVLAAARDAAQKDPSVVLISPHHRHHASLSTIASGSIGLLKSLLVHPPHLCGMPIPFRPATTLYRSDELIATFRELRSLRGGLRGLIIPMVMKALHPTARFIGLPPVGPSSVTTPLTPLPRSDETDSPLPDAIICLRVIRSLSVRPPVSLAVTVIQYLIVSGWIYWTSASALSAALLLGPLTGTVSLSVFGMTTALIGAVVALAERANFSDIGEEIVNSLRVPLMIASSEGYRSVLFQELSPESRDLSARGN